MIKLQDLNCSEASIIKLTAYPDTRQGQGGGDIILESVKCNLKPIPGFQVKANFLESNNFRWFFYEDKFWFSGPLNLEIDHKN